MSIARITLAAPAKLNLHLEILGRRADGFHALETIFQTIELADRIEVERHAGHGISLVCDDASLPSGPGNLAWRAAELFIAGREEEAGALRILLEKAIPHGAGLGGGSSDAAAVLQALARLLPAWRTPAELSTLAAELGSDVPFFLIGGTALGHGRGELLAEMPELPRLPVTVLMPAAALPTPQVFRELRDDERGPRVERGVSWWRERLAQVTSGDQLAGLMANRLTGPARRLSPEVGQLLDWLAARRVPHLMSGSGASCFALAHIEAPPQVEVWHTWLRSRASPVG